MDKATTNMFHCMQKETISKMAMTTLLTGKRKREDEPSDPTSDLVPHRQANFDFTLEETVSNTDEYDLKETLTTVREQLQQSNMTEAICRKKIEEYHQSHSCFQSKINVVRRAWNQFDEDLNIFRNRIDDGNYDDLVNNNIDLLSDFTQEKFEGKARKSKEQFSQTLNKIQIRQERLDTILIVLKWENKSVPSLEKIVQEECATINKCILAHKRFKNSYKRLASDLNLLKAQEVKSSKSPSRNELEEAINNFEWKIFKLRCHRVKMSTNIKELQGAYQLILSRSKNPELQRNEITKLKYSTILENTDLLLQLKDCKISQQQAVAELHSLYGLQDVIVIESVPYQKLQKAISSIERFLPKQYIQLDRKLSENTTARRQLVELANEKELKELKIQSETRKEVLNLMDQVNVTKRYLEDKREELHLHQVSTEYFLPVNEELQNLYDLTLSRNRLTHAFLEFMKNKERKLLTERGKLLQVNKEMHIRIYELQKACSSTIRIPRILDECKLNDISGKSNVIRELMKAKSVKKELQFQIDLFKNNVSADTVPIEESLKRTQHAIEHVRMSIKKFKNIKSLTNLESSLTREVEYSNYNQPTLLAILEQYGQSFDRLSAQNAELKRKVIAADNRGLHEHTLQSKRSQDQDKGDDKNPAAFDIGVELDEKGYKLTHLQSIAEKKTKLEKLHASSLRATLADTKRIRDDAIKTVYRDQFESKLLDLNKELNAKSEALNVEKLQQVKLLHQIVQVKKSFVKIQQEKVSKNVDEVTMEEIRQYKEILMCPVCQKNHKDAIIRKCKHTFCHGCLKNVKNCPKCQTAIKKKYVHKLYLV